MKGKTTLTAEQPEEPNISQTYAAQDEVASQVWDDPDLDEYNHQDNAG